MNKMTENKGFTLIELSIVLSISAILMAGIVTVAANHLEQQRFEDSFNKMQRIMQAIDNFVDENGYIPCPAANNVKMSYYSYGRSVCGSGVESTSNNITAGIVPINLLNLPISDTIDSWGRKFTYVIDNDLTTIGSYPVNTPDIEIINIGGGAGSGKLKSLHADTITNAAMVLISHGKNGFGAFEANSTTRNASGTKGDIYEQYNNSATGFNGMFSQGLINGGDPESIYSYDDIVIYRKKHQFVDIYE